MRWALNCTTGRPIGATNSSEPPGARTRFNSAMALRSPSGSSGPRLRDNARGPRRVVDVMPVKAGRRGAIVQLREAVFPPHRQPLGGAGFFAHRAEPLEVRPEPRRRRVVLFTIVTHVVGGSIK